VKAASSIATALASLAAAATFALQCPSAAAATFVVLDEPVHYDRGAEARFEINRSMGRAWVEASAIDSHATAEESGRTQDFRALVPGLRYDEATRQVVFGKDGREVPCATVKNRRILGRSYKSTGHCALSATIERRAVDDGFHVRKRSYLRVVLEVPSL
jgi:hypothetical protein